MRILNHDLIILKELARSLNAGHGHRGLRIPLSKKANPASLYMKILHVKTGCSLSRQIPYRNSVLQAKVFQDLAQV
jgi:hypothetical protein